ncbi:hypothetical protein X743_14945 [Mesorhizobium sp. LNHC252B00]|uniref:hypothetical protein n=1 Tax=Mesorhizobium sp. LNHC252B00 TaxID=1287252 RepID=UPI0003CF5497|nr:hypothetical protein [Mesorhizobium sp. LNHC252B00]ESY72800.1 hypothetical protein X743_14945 [Mesorhizobium sp. LNHC252B00]
MTEFDIDIDGPTPEQIAAAIDRCIVVQLERDELFLSDHGVPTEDEVADFLTLRKAVLAEWKADTLAEIIRWASDPSAPSLKVQ